MSKPMMGGAGRAASPQRGHAANVVAAAPTTPPAGPDSIAQWPEKAPTCASPPSDRMKSTFADSSSPAPPAPPPVNPARNVLTYRAMCGVRYASAAVVKPRGTTRTIGMTSDDRDTCAPRGLQW